uniref:RRM domain-containing protein n=1 Tax=Panagrolaimus davidi TaxID=227884 RepID=A0A914Q3D8_9BILA
MTRVSDDLHRMVDYIKDLRNMMMIGVDLFIIIGILILTIGLAILTIIGSLVFLVLKRQNGKQGIFGPQTPSALPSESVKSGQNHPTTLIMNDDYTCIPQLNIPVPTTPTTMPYFSDPPAAAAYGAPPLTTSVSTAATPSVSSLINSKDPSMFKARVFVGNLNACVSREDLVGLFKCCGNVLGVTLFDEHALVQFSTQTEAKLSVQILNGYTWKGSELAVKTLTLYSTNDANNTSSGANNINGSFNMNNASLGFIETIECVKLIITVYFV